MLRIEFERRKRGLTQKQLGESVNPRMSGADICRIEKGVLKPYPGHIKRLSSYLKVPENDLLKGV